MGWSNEKHHYNIIRIEDGQWNWCYSAQELEELLNTVCCGKKIIRWMADLVGYLDAAQHRANFLDLSYMGGNTLLILDGVALEFDIRVEGLIGYRIFQPWDMHIRPVNAPIPEDYITNPIYFCDLKDDFTLVYANAVVQEVIVDSTDSWGFSAGGFDEEKAAAAAEANDLPRAIRFMLDNGVELCLYADQLEYYAIELKQKDAFSQHSVNK